MLRLPLTSALLFIVFLNNIYAQKGRQEFQLAAYNVGFGALTAAIGSVINKPKDMRASKAFIKGLWQGSIGGLLNYGGKKSLYLINRNENKLYAWPANILHAAGTSIMENAALHQPFLQNWHFNYTCVRFDFSVNGQKKFKVRFLPESIFAVYCASTSGSFDFQNTLLAGHIIFTDKNYSSIIFRKNVYAGYNFGRAIAVGADSEESNAIIAHEIAHSFQYNEDQIFNTWFNPLVHKIKSPVIKKIFGSYIYADVPYSVWQNFLLPKYDGAHYYKNFFEFEAEFFATNQYVHR